MTVSKFFLCVILLWVVLASSPVPRSNGNEPVNRWVYDSMHRYYFWADDMPAHPDYSLPTHDFFKKLLSRKDRFSWISNRNEGRQARSCAESFGFHYALIDGGAVITLVLPGSAAGNNGLKRGMVFTQVNGKPIDKVTVEAALCMPTALLQMADSSQVALRNIPFAPPGVYATHVFEGQGKKTGYLAYFRCEDSQDAILLRQVGKLKQAGVGELILDLRYNPGGSVASVVKLAAMLIPVFDPSKVFITYTGNRHSEKLSFEQAMAFSGNKYLPVHHLGLKRLYILTGRSTASAAELLINNLSPFMQVVRIGETTRGKDEASFPIKDPRIPWTIMPTIYKIGDANGRGDYADGIKPDYVVKDTGCFSLGTMDDLAVSKALQLIYGRQVVTLVMV